MPDLAKAIPYLGSTPVMYHTFADTTPILEAASHSFTHYAYPRSRARLDGKCRDFNWHSKLRHSARDPGLAPGHGSRVDSGLQVTEVA